MSRRGVPRDPSAGYSLAEMLTALVIAGAFLAALASLLHEFSKTSRGVVRRVEVAQSVRTIWVVLEEELSAGRWGVDWHLDGEHAVGLRAFRGLARVLGETDDPGRWEVSWVGHRVPDPDRDSLLVMTDEGEWQPVALEWTGAGSAVDAAPGVMPGARAAVWQWTMSGEARPVLVRVFETGRYSLEDGAFRYRRGQGGRQPLTPEILGPASRFGFEEEGIRAHLHFADGGRTDWMIPLIPAMPPAIEGALP